MWRKLAECPYEPSAGVQRSRTRAATGFQLPTPKKKECRPLDQRQETRKILVATRLLSSLPGKAVRVSFDPPEVG